MIIHTLPSGPFDTNAYVVACPTTKKAAIIDPAPDSYDKILNTIESNHLKPQMILLTHSHWDHIAETARIKKQYQLPVYIHPLDAPNLESPGADKLPCWIAIEGVDPDKLIEEGEIISLGDLQFHVIHTPGHTPGGVCFYCPQENLLISGDTLFKGTIGNISFPTARPRLMWESLKKLSKLPKETLVYPGHGPSTTIGTEHWLANAEDFFG